MVQAQEVSLIVSSICCVVQFKDHTSHSVYIIHRWLSRAEMEDIKSVTLRTSAEPEELVCVPQRKIDNAELFAHKSHHTT